MEGVYIFDQEYRLHVWIYNLDGSDIKVTIDQKEGYSDPFNANVFNNCFVSDPEQPSLIATGCLDDSKNILTIHYKYSDAAPVDIIATRYNP